MGSYFVSEAGCGSSIDQKTTEICTTDLAVDAYPISSFAVSGTWSGGFLSVKSDADEENNLKYKRLKFMAPNQQRFMVQVPDNSSPLGLTLRKTPSFLSLVEDKLSLASICSSESRKKENILAIALKTAAKTKASNFSASFLRIGTWERSSRFEGQLAAKFYYAKQKLVWEVLNFGLKNKIEFPWSNVASLKATFSDNGDEILEIELSWQPLFFEERNPQPRKHTVWKAIPDFTGGHASTYRRHFLQFPQGVLHKHYEKLLKSDGRLSSLSKKPYPALDSPFFGTEQAGDQNSSCHPLLAVEEQNLNILKQSLGRTTSHEYLEHSQISTLSTMPSVLQLSKLELPVAYRDTDFPESVINLSSVEGWISGYSDVQQISWLPFWQDVFAGAGNPMDYSTSSASISNMFPNVFGSFLPQAPDFGTSAVATHYCCMKEGTEDDMIMEQSDVNSSVLGVDQLEPYVEVNSNGSIINKEPLLQISEFQTDWNIVFPIGSCNVNDSQNELDGYVSYGCSFPEESARQVSGNHSSLLENISGTGFPLLFVEDSMAMDDIGEVEGRTKWTLNAGLSGIP